MISKRFRSSTIVLGLAIAALVAPATHASTDVCSYERVGATQVLPGGMKLAPCAVVRSESSLAAGAVAVGVYTGEAARTTIPLPGGEAVAE